MSVLKPGAAYKRGPKILCEAKECRLGVSRGWIIFTFWVSTFNIQRKEPIFRDASYGVRKTGARIIN